MGDLLGLLESAGFVEVEWVGETAVRTSRFTRGVAIRAGKPLTAPRES